jgi:predicted acyltransferase
MVSTRTDDTPQGAGTGRVESIDVFRGLTMFLMLIVNDLNDPDLGNISGVPAWMQHAPGNVDGMTFVDVIFPAFLFSVGLCIPLALQKRLHQDGSTLRALRHVLVRTLGLVVIGLGMVNTYRFHPDAMIISPGLWELLFFVSVLLVWNRYPVATVRMKRISTALRIAGAAMLLVLAVIYRGTDSDGVTWMRTSWWGILTAIGLAYWVASIAYLMFRRDLAAMIGVLAFLTALNIAERTGALPFLDPIRPYFSAGGMFGGLGSIAVAGVVVGMLFMNDATRTARDRMRWLLGFAVALYAMGALLRPPYGISKLGDTPAWCLMSTAICVAVFAFLYWLVDLKGRSAWARFAMPAGRQPLLAYILPHIFYSILLVLGIDVLQAYLNAGYLGIARSVVLALMFIGVTKLLTRAGVNLRL